MKVFISWSGETSRAVASKLDSWLEDVIQNSEAFMSKHDITSGGRWASTIAQELDDTQFGVLVLTQDNLTAPWIQFEAGALSKKINDSFVVPYLVNVDKSDVGPPLSQFQMEYADEDGTWNLVESINDVMAKANAKALKLGTLERAFKVHWPTLQECISTAPKPQAVGSPETNEMISEILASVRELSLQPTSKTSYSGFHKIDDLEKRLGAFLQGLTKEKAATPDRIRYLLKDQPELLLDALLWRLPTNIQPKVAKALADRPKPIEKVPPIDPFNDDPFDDDPFGD